MVEWGTGENILEPLTIIIGGDTVACALYAYDGQEKGEWYKLVSFYYFKFFSRYPYIIGLKKGYMNGFESGV